jgi:hypothetical protein
MSHEISYNMTGVKTVWTRGKLSVSLYLPRFYNHITAKSALTTPDLPGKDPCFTLILGLSSSFPLA